MAQILLLRLKKMKYGVKELADAGWLSPSTFKKWASVVDNWGDNDTAMYFLCEDPPPVRQGCEPY